ncbi:MAG: hypothetical protein CMF42_00785 [Legionellales bacterium]|nr:hypothetical protein [Legionellales bacterium]OUX68295.1 MAG: hypothetical protein CBD38_00330 [bacterium TMED178]|tara:strand:- start:5712 stop:5894 length:183 start_codon:yes stop_codon:yes gene_type:complete
MLTVFKTVKLFGKAIFCVAATFWLFGLTPVQDLSSLTIKTILKGQHFFVNTFGLNQFEKL